MKTTLATLAFIAASVAPHSQTGDGRAYTTSVYAVESRFTSGGGAGLGFGLGLERALGPWLSVAADVQAVRSANTDPFALIAVDFRWHDRTQTVAHAALVARPVRFEVGSATNEIKVLVGPALRWKDERVLVAGWPGTHDEGDAQYVSARAASAEWRARGGGYEVVTFYHDGSAPSGDLADLPASVYDPGYVFALVYSSAGFDVGVSGGLGYDVSVGRASVGARAVYRRYAGQEMLTGSHSYDPSLRAGYRF